MALAGVRAAAPNVEYDDPLFGGDSELSSEKMEKD
jgi:hypothetical protein